MNKLRIILAVSLIGLCMLAVDAVSLALAATTRKVCADSAWVRQSDLSHVIGILYRGDTMAVERYVWKSNGNSQWAYGTAHTRQGNRVGYVEVYPSNPFC